MAKIMRRVVRDLRETARPAHRLPCSRIVEPLEDETRYTASASYFTALGDESSVAATLAWGLKSISGGTKLNALLADRA